MKKPTKKPSAKTTIKKTASKIASTPKSTAASEKTLPLRNKLAIADGKLADARVAADKSYAARDLAQAQANTLLGLLTKACEYALYAADVIANETIVEADEDRAFRDAIEDIGATAGISLRERAPVTDVDAIGDHVWIVGDEDTDDEARNAVPPGDGAVLDSVARQPATIDADAISQ